MIVARASIANLARGVEARSCPPITASTGPCHYRNACDYRKPKPGLLLLASREWNIDLSRSYTVGNGVMDILGGRNVGRDNAFREQSQVLPLWRVRGIIAHRISLCASWGVADLFQGLSAEAANSRSAWCSAAW